MSFWLEWSSEAALFYCVLPGLRPAPRGICFTVIIFLIMTCYLLHAPSSGCEWGLGGNTQAMRKHQQTVHTVHFLGENTLFCTVCTQWQGNTLAQSVQFHCSGSANKQMMFQKFPAATTAYVAVHAWLNPTPVNPFRRGLFSPLPLIRNNKSSTGQERPVLYCGRSFIILS